MMGCELTTEEVDYIDRAIAALKSENDGYAGQLTQLSLEVGLLRKKNTELLRANEKLRELAERAWKTAERLCQAFDGPCRDDGTTIYDPCPMGERDEECVYGQLQRELRECGVEVDG